jgi:hypothetical protein
VFAVDDFAVFDGGFPISRPTAWLVNPRFGFRNQNSAPNSQRVRVTENGGVLKMNFSLCALETNRLENKRNEA